MKKRVVSFGVQIFIEHIGIRESWNASLTHDMRFYTYAQYIVHSKRLSKFDQKKKTTVATTTPLLLFIFALKSINIAVFQRYFADVQLFWLF